ncbi:hypothetical protein Scep_007538 [Stephania cephalantha]|uniref:Uncharacterized protein n=1 Tax=Stephania cephalantha TaxID=152367 RepID=A0AAP0PQ54_9MAGN
MSRSKTKVQRPPHRGAGQAGPDGHDGRATSIAGLQVVEGVHEMKHPTSSYRKQKNLDAKECPIKKSKLGQPDLEEPDVEGIGMTSIGERIP